jgi:hypothetical protein
MRTSESITELAEALAHAQDELENAPRDERNPHFGSEYASLSSATNTIRPAFTGDRNAYCLGLTESLLDQKKIPTLPEHEYQEWAEYLFHAPLHLQVAETLFRHDRQHPHALGLFLACVYPIAQRSADRVMVLSGISRKDLTQELMFNGAINEVIHFFRADQLGEDTDFRAALYLTLKVGALNAIFNRVENARVQYYASVDRHGAPPPPRTLERLFAKEMLEKIAALETDPPKIGVFLRALVNLGPDALSPSSRSRNRIRRTHFIDYEEVCNKLGITYYTACAYFAMARKILRKLYNPDGSLFMKTV